MRTWRRGKEQSRTKQRGKRRRKRGARLEIEANGANGRKGQREWSDEENGAKKRTEQRGEWSKEEKGKVSVKREDKPRSANLLAFVAASDPVFHASLASRLNQILTLF